MMNRKNRKLATRQIHPSADRSVKRKALSSAGSADLGHAAPDQAVVLPLGALLLASCLATPSFAQTPAAATPTDSATERPKPALVLEPVLVTGQSEPSAKDSLRTRTTTIGKGKQELRDIPQSITVVTEKLIDDRNLDTLKDVLHNTAGITFQAAEGGEEDIRLRGFSLANTGDIFLDGMRDPAFYERDTFNYERVELLRGSASMLFGRGSTGGAANQVSKTPAVYSDREVSLTLGSHQYRRLTGDLNIRLAESAAVRINAMHTTAQNDGKGNGLDKSGLAIAFRSGIGERHEFSASLSYLENRNPRMNYGLPWLPVTTPATAATLRTIVPGIGADAYYGLDSDRNASSATIFTASHLWRIAPKTELKTQIRRGFYERDQRASAIRFASNTTNLSNFNLASLFNRNTNLKIQNMDITQVQSDWSHSFLAAGYKHDLIAGVDHTIEDRTVFGARTAAQGGIVLAKPTISAGGLVTGGNNFIDESLRVLRTTSDFRARGTGAYVQDTWHFTNAWKFVAGLRYDNFKGVFNQYNLPNNAPSPVALLNYKQSIGELSKRFGILYQPDERSSYHLSYGTSFNTSADAYSYNATSANTPPEKSRNIEIGAKLESANKRFATRYAIFYAEKYNERNTDTDTAATSLLLSGKRHTAGVEFDMTGRINSQWEVYGSYAFIPDAKVDTAAACPPAPAQCLQSQPGERVGERPGLIPKHSGTIWSTYQVSSKWRVGAGINFRSQQKPVQSDIQAPGFATFDLLTEYRFSDTYVVKANLNNVANKNYADVLYRGHYVSGAGRTLQVNLTARF